MRYAAAACMLTAVAPAAANAQTSPGPEGNATPPVAQVVEPVSAATEQVAAAVEPVSGATGQVAAAAEPVSRVTEHVVAAAEPVSRVTEHVVAAAEPVSRVTGELVTAAQPVLDATGQVADAARPVVDGVAAPAVRLGAAAAPVRDVVDGVTRPVGGALTGDRSSSPDRGGAGQPAATFGRPGSGGPPSGDAEGASSTRPATGGLSGVGPQSTAPETLGAGIGSPPATKHGAAPVSRPDETGTALPQDPRADAPAFTTGLLVPGLADVLAPPSPETSTSTSQIDRHAGQVSPEPQPTPAPAAPAGAAAAGSASAGSAGPVLALLALLLLAAPRLSLFLRTAPEFLRPAPFIVALERPG